MILAREQLFKSIKIKNANKIPYSVISIYYK